MNLNQKRAALKQRGAEALAAFGAYSSARIALSRVLNSAFQILVTDERLGTLEEFGETYCPGLSNSEVSRLRVAGEVAEVLGASVGDATERHLEPLYRVINVKGDEARLEAEESARALWADLTGSAKNGKPTISAVSDAVDKIRPPAKPRAKGKSATAGKSAPTTTDADQETVDAAMIAATSAVSSYVSKSDTPGAVLGVMLKSVTLCETHGTSAVFAAVKSAQKALPKESK